MSSTPRRLAVLSDIHGNWPALQAVLADLKQRAVDAVLNLGDALSGPLQPLQTARFLMQQQDWVHLAGNHERQVLTLAREQMGLSDAHAAAELGAAERAWMAALPHSRALDDEVWLCHASPRSDVEPLLELETSQGMLLAPEALIRERLAGVQAELVLCGHTHWPRSVRLSAGPLIVNPGSLGQPGYRADEGATPYRLETGSPDARYAIVERGASGWRVELISLPYPEAADQAALAAARGRPEWAAVLARGRL